MGTKLLGIRYFDISEAGSEDDRVEWRVFDLPPAFAAVPGERYPWLEGFPIGMGVVDPGSGKGNRMIGPGSDGKLEPYERDSSSLAHAHTYTNKFLPPAPARRERSSILFQLI